MRKYNIALISPNENCYSETFIQAHRELVFGNIFYYYNGRLPRNCYGRKPLLDDLNIFYKIGDRLIPGGIKNISELALKKSFRKNNIDLVLAEYGPTGCDVLPVCKELNLPLIVHFHGKDAHCFDVLRRFGGTYKELFGYSRFIIVVSEYMRKALLKLGAPEEKLILNPYGSNNGYLKIESDVTESNTVISVGRFVDKKAPYYNILAFAKVLRHCPGLELVMVGDGPLLETCRNLARYLEIDDCVTFIGVLSREEIVELFARSRFFIQHSVIANNGDTEGTPVSILEAQAAGLPVVSTKHAGINEAVVDGKTGFLVAEHDITSMATRMKQLAENNELAKKMSIQAKRHITENYSMERHIQKINELIAFSVT